MNWEAIIFWALATLVVIPALGIVATRNIVHMAFWLLGTLMGVAGLYLLMGADFLGLTQVMVYIGGINVLLLFGIMLTNREPIYLRKMAKRPRMVPAVVMGLLVLWGLLTAFSETKWKIAESTGIPGTGGEGTGADGTSATLGTWLLSDYILPFEIVSILLLVVLVGAAYIARRTPVGEEA
ncbi:MAG: NADH-quinone oxidoreductase subunit J [Planctomycetes bacterium]|nr:NADH-quinone oxidoreductase subunit J [Planctomycetota bacterium]